MWLPALAIAIAAALTAWLVLAPYGWLAVTFGPFAYLFWSGALLWGVIVWIAIHDHRQWWLLATFPAVVYPLAMAILLVLACTLGDSCL